MEIFLSFWERRNEGERPVPAFVTLMDKMQFLMFRNHFGGQRSSWVSLHFLLRYLWILRRFPEPFLLQTGQFQLPQPLLLGDAPVPSSSLWFFLGFCLSCTGELQTGPNIPGVTYKSSIEGKNPSRTCWQHLECQKNPKLCIPSHQN